MYKYVAFQWNPEDADANVRAQNWCRQLQLSSPRWTLEFSISGFSLFTISAFEPILKSYKLHGQRGAILGRLFESDHLSQTSGDDVTNEFHSRQIVETEGGHLVNHFWGNYVAFIAGERERKYFVIRSCSGAIACYSATIGGVHVISSDIAEVSRLTGHEFSIDREYLAAFLYYDQMRIRQCPLNGVSELLAGDCLTIEEESKSQSSLWHPKNICTSNRFDEASVAGTKLAEATQLCVESWGKLYSRIIHSLSGGLDSAIVLGCINRARERPVVTCANRYNERGGEDERYFARLAAHRAGCELLEYPWNACERTFGDWIFEAPRMAKPSVPYIISILDSHFVNQIASRVRAQAIWTGQGGDHLFLASRTSTMAADFLHNRGLTPAFASTALNATRLTQESYWTVLRKAWADRKPNAKWTPEVLTKLKALYLNPEALPSDPLGYIRHPWMTDLEAIPVGKRLQIQSISTLINRHIPMPSLEVAEERHPLISQPLIETCLQIPTYVLQSGGRQRGLARDVFACIVPREIIERDSKGSITSFVMSTMQQSRQFLHELLVDGVLMRERILDMKTLSPYLTTNRPIRSGESFPLFACIAAEVWARQWDRAKLKAVA